MDRRQYNKRNSKTFEVWLVSELEKIQAYRENGQNEMDGDKCTMIT